jgi:hypothetical protein
MVPDTLTTTALKILANYFPKHISHYFPRLVNYYFPRHINYCLTGHITIIFLDTLILTSSGPKTFSHSLHNLYPISHPIYLAVS